MQNRKFATNLLSHHPTRDRAPITHSLTRRNESESESMSPPPTCNGATRCALGHCVPLPLVASVLEAEAQRQARVQRRWNMLRTYVRVTRRLVQELAYYHGRRFSSAQSSLVNVAITRKSSVDLLFALHEQFRVLFDADACVLSFELFGSNASVLEFDGQKSRLTREHNCGSIRAREAARTSMRRPTFLANTKACTEASIKPRDGCTHVQSYLCMPLVDSTGHVQALVEIYNSQWNGKEITRWIGKNEDDGSRAYVSTRDPLQGFCGFIGTLLRAVSPIEHVINHSSNRENVLSSLKRSCHSNDRRSSSIETLVHLLDILRRALQVDGWTVYRLDQEANSLWARLASAEIRNKVATVALGHGIIGRAASTGKPLIDDTMLCVPVFDESTPPFVTSVVVLYGSQRTPSDNCRAFRPCDLELCHLVCSHVGRSLHLLALEDAAKKAQDQAQATLELSEVLFRDLERSPKPFEMVLTAARVIIEKLWLRATECNVYMRNAVTRELCVFGSATQGGFPTPLAAVSHYVTVAARSGNIVNVRDAQIDALACENHAKPLLVVPVKDPTSGNVLGVLEFINKQPSSFQEEAFATKMEKRFFDQNDEELARGFARQLASALRNAQRLEIARVAERKSAALLSLRPSAAIGSLPEDHAGSVFFYAEAAACRALGASHGALFFVDAPSRSLFARVGADWRGYGLAMGQKLQGRVAATGAAVRLDREAWNHPEFDSEYDRLMGIQTSSLLCIPIKAQPSTSAFPSSSVPFTSSGTFGRCGRRGSSFSTSSSTDDESDDRPVIGVFYAVNKVNLYGDTVAFDAEDEQLLRAICVELAALVERRAWELVFESSSYDDSDSSDNDTESHVTRTFLSQYITASPVRCRQRPRSRLPSARNDHDHAAALVAATSYHEGCFKGSSSGGGGLCSLPGSLGYSTGLGSESPLLQWDLDPWQYSPAQLIDLSVEMFELHHLMDGFALPETNLRRFLQSVQAQYLDVPYHNTYHAFATLHMTFLMLSAQCKKLAPYLKASASNGQGLGPVTKAQAIERSRQKRCGNLILAPRERLALFVAAFCHDMGHDARTNDFHVRCNSRLARRYNDQSVLENMHAAACFETMRRPGHDVLAGLDDGSGDAAACRRLVRKRIIRSILATDMHRHASIVATLHEAQLHGSRYVDDKLRELLVDAVIHSADVSGPTQTCEQHFRWTTRLLEEFNEQHAEEVELGISATAFMDGGPNSAEFARVNLAFVDSCAFPLWRALGGLLAGLEGCLANVERNRAMWATRLEEATKGETKERTEKTAPKPIDETVPMKTNIPENDDQGNVMACSKEEATKRLSKVLTTSQPMDIPHQKAKN